MDTIPVSIAIYGDSSFFEKLSSAVPVALTVAIKNKAGNFIKGVPVVFSAGLNSGSLNHRYHKHGCVWHGKCRLDTEPDRPETNQQVIAKVIYKNTSLSVSFHALLTHDTLYNYIGTLTMDSTNMPGGGFIGFTDTTNAPDPFTIVSDSMALSNGIPYPFELDGMMIPTLLPGEHGVGGSALMTINKFLYPQIHVNYEVSGFIIIEATNTETFTNPEPCTVTIYWQLRGGGNSYDAYLPGNRFLTNQGNIYQWPHGKDCNHFHPNDHSLRSAKRRCPCMLLAVLLF